MTASRRTALAAGAFYLATHVSSVAAAVAYGPALTDPSSSAAEAGATGLRVGVMLELVLALACVGTGVALLVILRDAAPALALTFASLRLLEAAVIAAGTLPMLALAWMQDAAVAAADTEVFAQALADVHRASFLVGQGLVIGVNTLVLAVMLHCTKTVPFALAVLGFAGGTLVLASDIGQLAGWVPLNGVVAGLCAAPIFAFELWFAGYLLFVGLRPRVAAAKVEAAGGRM
ncbi:MAG: DUF4386 domain-containing protein [Microbacterium sp.]|nr:MAG: DUF4386 domain-containing protein [Microbacterium sp.]